MELLRWYVLVLSLGFLMFCQVPRTVCLVTFLTFHNLFYRLILDIFIFDNFLNSLNFLLTWGGFGVGTVAAGVSI